MRLETRALPIAWGDLGHLNEKQVASTTETTVFTTEMHFSPL
jgi:hypothetical protein